MEQDRKVYTVGEVMLILGISRVKAYQLVHQEGFPVVRLGRSIRIPVEAFHRWLNSQCEQPMQ